MFAFVIYGKEHYFVTVFSLCENIEINQSCPSAFTLVFDLILIRIL